MAVCPASLLSGFNAVGLGANLLENPKQQVYGWNFFRGRGKSPGESNNFFGKTLKATPTFKAIHRVTGEQTNKSTGESHHFFGKTLKTTPTLAGHSPGDWFRVDFLFRIKINFKAFFTT
jgi:hypothetical protein